MQSSKDTSTTTTSTNTTATAAVADAKSELSSAPVRLGSSSSSAVSSSNSISFSSAFHPVSAEKLQLKRGEYRNILALPGNEGWVLWNGQLRREDQFSERSIMVENNNGNPLVYLREKDSPRVPACTVTSDGNLYLSSDWGVSVCSYRDYKLAQERDREWTIKCGVQREAHDRDNLEGVCALAFCSGRLYSSVRPNKLNPKPYIWISSHNRRFSGDKLVEEPMVTYLGNDHTGGLIGHSHPRLLQDFERLGPLHTNTAAIVSDKNQEHVVVISDEINALALIKQEDLEVRSARLRLAKLSQASSSFNPGNCQFLALSGMPQGQGPTFFARVRQTGAKENKDTIRAYRVSNDEVKETGFSVRCGEVSPMTAHEAQPGNVVVDFVDSDGGIARIHYSDYKRAEQSTADTLSNNFLTRDVSSIVAGYAQDPEDYCQRPPASQLDTKHSTNLFSPVFKAADANATTGASSSSAVRLARDTG